MIHTEENFSFNVMIFIIINKPEPNHGSFLIPKIKCKQINQQKKGLIMNILERLKLELNNKEYFTDEQFTVYLNENEINSEDMYTKELHQRGLLYTVIDILEAVSNDVDLLRKTQTEFMTTESAYKHLEQRIEKIKQRIYSISDKQDESNLTLMFSRG